MIPPTDSAPPAAPAPPGDDGRRLFGDALPAAARYAEILAGPGVERGLIGPREPARLWDRHLISCALVADLLPRHARVVDVGSGAGLPGIPMALRRPDLTVVLLEPMLRRTTFLEETVADLQLGDRVTVVRGRAEDAVRAGLVDPVLWVVARAVAPIERLVKWCLPLLADGGALLAMKGATADDEVAEARHTLHRYGAGKVEVVSVRAEPDLETRVVRVMKRAASRRRA